MERREDQSPILSLLLLVTVPSYQILDKNLLNPKIWAHLYQKSKPNICKCKPKSPLNYSMQYKPFQSQKPSKIKNSMHKSVTKIFITRNFIPFRHIHQCSSDNGPYSGDVFALKGHNALAYFLAWLAYSGRLMTMKLVCVCDCDA